MSFFVFTWFYEFITQSVEFITSVFYAVFVALPLIHQNGNNSIKQKQTLKYLKL